jgi:8-oxo-dGTP diphosphatase
LKGHQGAESNQCHYQTVLDGSCPAGIPQYSQKELALDHLFPPGTYGPTAAFSQRCFNKRLRRSIELESNPTFILVVAAAIFDEAGRLLLEQALPHKRHAGQWEFPGGKVEPVESPRFALCREVHEELAVELDQSTLEPVGFAEEASTAGRPALVLLLYRCSRWSGDPVSCEGQGWGWFAPDEASSLPMPDMDRALLGELLRNPSR